VDNHGFRYYDPEVGRYLTRDPIGFGDGMNVYLHVGDNPINHIDPHGLASTSANWEPGQGHNDAPYRADYSSTTREEANDLRKFQPKLPESTCSIVQNRGGGSGEEKAGAAAEHEKWANHWKSYPVTGPAVRAGEDIDAGNYGKAALNVGNAIIDGWGAGGLIRGGLRKTLISEGKEWFAAKSTGTESVNAATALQSKLSALETAQQTAARTRALPEGRIRYYGAETAASKPGPTRGASYVTEWDPKTGNVRSWMESYGQAGDVSRVHPKMINGQTVNAPHYPSTGKELGL
jgi:hypothetical protein